MNQKPEIVDLKTSPLIQAAPPGRTPAQRLIHRACFVGVSVGLIQLALSGAALWIALELLKEGTLIARASVVLPVSSLAIYLLALRSMARLRRHQRFSSWIPTLSYLAGLAVCAALALLHKTDLLGTGGLRELLVQPGATLPADLIMGESRPLLLIAATLSVAGALGILPLFYILRMRLNPDTRRLLRWMSTQ